MGVDPPHERQCIATQSIGYLLRRAHRLSLQLAEGTFVGAELSFVQWIALVLLRDGAVDTAGGLARTLGHDGGAMTRMLDQLETRGLVVRDRSTTDRRVVHLSLTALGREAANRLAPRVMALWDELLADFAADEVTQLTGLLHRLIARMSTLTSERGEA